MLRSPKSVIAAAAAAILVVAMVVAVGPIPARAEDTRIDHARLIAVASGGDVLIVQTSGRLAAEDTDDDPDYYRYDVASGSFTLIRTTEPEHEDQSVDVVAASPNARYLVWGASPPVPTDTSPTTSTTRRPAWRRRWAPSIWMLSTRSP